jgi:ParB family chromosome partitioning protein
MSKQALGKGFDGLIPVGFSVDNVAAPGEQIKKIAIENIVPNPDQPRKSFDEKSLHEMSESLKQHGVIQPLVVTPLKDKNDHYRIVAGERRYRAAQLARLKKLPVIIRDHKELEELEISIVENVQRVDLSPLETAVSIARLRDQFSLTPNEIAKKLGKAETTVSNIIRLLKLPPEAVKAMQENKISEGHARAILALKTDEKLQKELLNTIITQNISVREAEDFVKKNRTKNTKKSIDSTTQKSLDKLAEHTESKVSISPRKNGGLLTMEFKDQAHLKKLVKYLSK